MGICSKYIFPRLMHWSMSRPGLADERKKLLALVEGKVLEIGFGTGLNLPHYPAHVKKLVAVESNADTWRLAEQQLQASPIDVQPIFQSGEILPFGDRQFDTVVTTFTLCSIRDVAAALREIRRVLRLDGRYLFLEHGLSREPTVARWQHRFTPLTKWLGEGCHLDRPIGTLIRSADFEFDRYEEGNLDSMPKLGGYLYRGAAK